MKKYLKKMAGGLGLFLLFPVAVNAQDSNWLNGFGGDFHNTGNWSNGVPGVFENAVFDLPITYAVDLTADHHVNALNMNAGQLTFTGGHELTVTGWSTMTRRITLSGLNTHLNYQQVLTIANAPTVDIEQGAILQADRLRMAPYLGSSDTITLSDADSEIRCNEFHLGSVDGVQLGGSGTFILDEDARIVVGEDNDFNSKIVVDRSDGIPAEMTITSGSQFLFEGPNATPIRVGVGVGAEGILKVSDPGSLLSAPDKNVYIAYSGTGSFLIENGAQVDAANVFVGYVLGSNGTMSMTGPGTLLTTNNFTMSLGGNASVEIEDSAEVDVFSLLVGGGDVAADLSVVTGAHCDADYAYIGTNDGTGTLEIDRGGTVQTNIFCFVANDDDATGNVNITGSGSSLTTPGLILGADIIGTVRGTANLFVDNLGNLVVGDLAPLTGSTNILVGGTYQPSIYVSDQAFVDNTGDTYVGYGVGMDGSIEIIGLNAYWYNEGSFFIGHYGEGDVVVNEGRLTVNETIEINDASTLSVDFGTVEAAQGFLVDGTVTMFGGTLIGDLELLVSGALQVESNATIEGSVIHSGGEVDIHNGVVLTVTGNQSGNWDYSGLGEVHIEGNVDFGTSPQSNNFNGSIHLGDQSIWHVKLGGEASGSFDSMDTDRFTTDPGAEIAISLMNGFVLAPGQEFVIVTRTIGSEPFGNYSEGDIVASQSGVNVRITYTAGDGNDIALYTADVIAVEPQVLNIERGNLAAGAVQSLRQQDNQDISLQRNPIDIQGRTEFELEAFSPTNSPSSMGIGIEGSVFARTEVIQTIFLYDFHHGQWEEVDARPASRFTDRTDTVSLTGNLSRFVNQSSGKMRARVRFVSSRPRQLFTNNTDYFSWRIEM